MKEIPNIAAVWSTTHLHEHVDLEFSSHTKYCFELLLRHLPQVKKARSVMRAKLQRNSREPVKITVFQSSIDA